MKIPLCILIPAFLAGAEIVSAAEREFRVELESMPEIATIAINGVGGDISAEGTDENAITIVADADDDDSTPRESKQSDGLRSLLVDGSDNTGLGLHVAADGDTYSIVSVRPHDDIDLQIRIPRSLGLKIAGVVDGDVTITGMQSEVSVQVVDGDVEATHAHAPFVVHAVDGDIEVQFDSFNSETPSLLQTVDGDVTVHLPADIAASLEMRTIDGNILTDLPMEVTTRDFAPSKGPSTVQATLNGGGTSLKVLTVDGDVVVRAVTQE